MHPMRLLSTNSQLQLINLRGFLTEAPFSFLHGGQPLYKATPLKTGETPSSLVIALAKFSKEPMFNPGALTLGELSSAVKDFGILTICLTIGWKGRGLIQPGIDLFKKASTFFDRAEI